MGLLERSKLLELKNMLEKLNNDKENLKNLKEIFTIDTKDLVLKIKELEKGIKSLKEQLSEEGIQEFNETGNKNLLGGLKIKEMEVVSYSEEDAFKFAKEKDLFLTLDKKAFDKSAKTLGVDFVKITKEPKVTFPSTIKLED